MKRREIISNTGPLIALASIDRLDILNNLFEKVVVPEAVHDELLEGGPAQAGISSYQQATAQRYSQASMVEQKHSSWR